MKRDAAVHYGYKAMFASGKSADTGDEVTPLGWRAA